MTCSRTIGACGKRTAPSAAALFLLREAASLIGVFVAAAMSRFVRSLAMVRRDLAHAVRAVRRRPGSSLGAILMLAAGLAAVAAAAGLASALLFRPISTRHPDEVRRLASADRTGRTRLAFSEVELEQIRANLSGTATVATANLQPVVLRIGDTDLQLLAEVTGGRYFDVIGLGMLQGRPLLEADANAGAPPLIVISERLWRQRFARDPSVLGTDIRLNGRAFTIVGVTAGTSTSSFLGGSVDAWITLAHADAMLDRSWRTNPDNRWWTTLVRADASAAAEVERRTRTGHRRAGGAITGSVARAHAAHGPRHRDGRQPARRCRHAVAGVDGVRRPDHGRGSRQCRRPVPRGRGRRLRARGDPARHRLGARRHPCGVT